MRCNILYICIVLFNNFGAFILDIGVSVDWDKKFDIFSRLFSVFGWVRLILDRWEGSNLAGVVRMCFGFSLFPYVVGFQFKIFVFRDISILRIGGRMGNLFIPLFKVLVSVGNLIICADILSSCVSVCCGSFLLCSCFSFCLTDFSFVVSFSSWNCG